MRLNPKEGSEREYGKGWGLVRLGSGVRVRIRVRARVRALGLGSGIRAGRASGDGE